MPDDDGELDTVFQALMHATRRDMLARLAQGELSVGELAAPLPVSLAAASKHVQVLERAGLITRTVAGRRHEFRLSAPRLAGATQWLVEHTSAADSAAAVPAAAEPEDATVRKPKGKHGKGKTGKAKSANAAERKSGKDKRKGDPPDRRQSGRKRKRKS
jgi:DNA-binding transcriptional ArsR family regulator